MDTVEPVLSFRGVVKQFGATVAVAGIDLDIAPGHIHALLGANGAGKSTLIKLLAGVYRHDSGTILFKGKEITGRAVDRLPINFIHQDLGLFDWMSVAENIAVVRGYARRGGLIDWRRLSREAREALAVLDADISPDAILGSLSKTDKTIVAIARALAAKSDVLVLDEPTASLPEADVAKLFGVLHMLRQAHLTMIYVSHRLDEIFRIADWVTVLRDGHKVASTSIEQTSPRELVLHIVGRPPVEIFHKPGQDGSSAVLEARDITIGPVGPVSFTLRGGEILGMCGLRGAAHQPVGRALCGVERTTSGSIQVGGRPVLLSTPQHALHEGIAFVSGNREESISADMSIQENLFLNPASLGRRLFHPVRRRAESRRADAIMTRFRIRPRGSARLASTLSGGNQQKVALARAMTIASKVLVLEEPTQGVDVGAKAEIYSFLNEALGADRAVVIVSSDLEEIAGECSRALVFDRTGVRAEVPRESMSVNHLIALVGGADQETPVR